MFNTIFFLAYSTFCKREILIVFTTVTRMPIIFYGGVYYLNASYLGSMKEVLKLFELNGKYFTIEIGYLSG